MTVFSLLNYNGAVLIEPPKKILHTNYTCGKTFNLDHILEMFKQEKVCGIVFVTGKMYAIYKISKTGTYLDYKKLEHYDAALPNNTSRSGYSQNRYARINRELHSNYITKLSEQVIKYFMQNNNTEYTINKLLIAGQDKKDDLANNELVKQYFNNKIISINMSDVNDESIHTTIQNTISLFDEEDDERADEILNEITEMMNLGADNLVFGTDDVMEAIANNELKKVILNDTLTNTFEEINFGKCELITISSYKMNIFGINIIGIKWY